MAFVEAKCTNCGAVLRVDNRMDAAICEYCGTPFIIEKAINNYSITNHNNIRADVVNYYGESSPDLVIRAGILEKYNGRSTHVSLPDEVKEIGRDCFNGLWIESINIPDSVVKINNFAFANCKSLTNVVLPKKLRYIGAHAFAGCTLLTNIVLPESLIHIGENAFSYTSIASIRIPGRVETVYSCFSKCSCLKNVFLSEGIKELDIGAFNDCPNLARINIPLSLEKIGYYHDSDTIGFKDDWTAFNGCPNLYDIEFAQGSKFSITDVYFKDTQAYIDAKVILEYIVQKERMDKGLCVYCGGKFQLFSRKCKSCGKCKSY